MTRKIVIPGGTGFIGRYIAPKLREMGYEVIIVTRNAAQAKEFVIGWDDTDALINALDGAEMVINLAGKSVDCRYNAKNRAEITSSRVETTKAVGEALMRCENPPELWINASTATIYRNSEDRPMTETTGEIGEGFSVDVAKAWENALFAFKPPKTRQIALRTAVVLGRGGGAIPPFMNLVRFGLGGKQAGGKQKFTWIHMEDLFRIILFLREHQDMNGAYNAVAPHPTDNQTFMRTLREKMGMKFGLPTPRWMLEIGAVMIGTESELIIKSRWALPERLLQAGFDFKYPTIDTAIEEIVHP